MTAFPFFKGNQSGVYVGEIIRSIAEDDYENLWLGTSAGIIKLSKDRESRVVYGKKNGVILQYRRIAWHIKPDNLISSDKSGVKLLELNKR